MQFAVADVLLLIWSGAAMTLFGALVGGILVFRTKRESHETLLARKLPGEDKFTAVNLDEIADGVADEPEPDVVPDLFGAKNREFLSQLVREKAANGE